MARLWVDMDQTFVLWVDEEDEPQLNQPVYTLVAKWILSGNPVTFWSTGGPSFARYCKARFVPREWWRYVDIDERGPLPGPIDPRDVFVDDAPLPQWRKQTIHPGAVRRLVY